MTRATQLDRTIAKGQLVGLLFTQDAVAASQAAAAMNLLEAGANVLATQEYVLPFEFELVGISLTSDLARTAGTLTVDATVNGGVTGLQGALDAANTLRDTGTQQRGLDVGAAGDRIGCKLTTDAGWTPITADIAVVVWAILHLDGV